MKTTLTIGHTLGSLLHSVELYKNGQKYATLTAAEAAQPWTDSEEAKTGDTYHAHTVQAPKAIPLDAEKMPGVFVHEAVHGALSAPYIVSDQEDGEGPEPTLTLKGVTK